MCLLLLPRAALAVEPGPAAAAPAPAPPATEGAAPATAPAAAEYVLEGGRVVAVQGEVRTPLSIPEPVHGILREGATLYVARGPAGAAVYDVTEPLAPRLVTSVPAAGSATGFHRVDGQIWVVVVQKSAVPFEGTGPAPLGVEASGGSAGASPAVRRTTEPGSASRKPPAPIAVVRVTPGTVEIAAGRNQGLKVGDLLHVYRSRRLDEDAPSGFTGEERVGTLEVVAVKDDSALAETGRGTIARVGDQARRAKGDEEADLTFPPRMNDVGEASVVLRPIVNAGRPLGVGVLADLEGSYWTDAYFVGLRLQPVGLGWTDSGSIVATAALVEGGYEGHALSVGLGAGLSWVNGDLDHMLQSFGGSADESGGAKGGPTREETQETHTAFTLSQMARLGARDGLNLWLHNLLLLHQDGDTGESGFIYGGTTARLTIPLQRRADFFLEGGGGVMGYWFAGLGVATWIRGNGAPGSWRLSVSAGAAGIRGSTEVTETYPASGGQPGWSDTYTDELDVAGPMVSLGLARRFGF